MQTRKFFHIIPSQQHEELLRYADDVFAMITRIVDDRRDAEELTQDTLLTAIQHIKQYDEHLGSLEIWIKRIAYNTAISFLRRRHLNTVSIEEAFGWEDAANDELTENELSTGREEQIMELERQVDLLSAEDKMLVGLYYFEDRPLEEIAFIINSNTQAVASRLYRIRNKLRKQLKRAKRFTI